MEGRTVPRLGESLRGSALLWAGFGCFLSTYCLGPLCVTYLFDLLGTWQRSLLAEFAMFAGTVGGCFALCGHGGYLRSKIPVPAGSAVYAAGLVVCLLVQHFVAGIEGTGLALVVAASIVGGLFVAYPLVFWFERLLAFCRGGGRSRCVAVLALSELVPVCVALALSLPSTLPGPVPFAAMALMTVVTAVCQVVLAGRSPLAGSVAAAGPTNAPSYRLTAYSRSMLVCFGATWSLACCVSTFNNATGTTVLSLPTMAVTLAAALAAIAWLAHERGGGSMRFGTLIRISIAFSGVALSLAPVLRLTVPALSYPLGEVAILLEEIAIVLFTVDLCYENGLDVAAVLPKNHGLFVASACGAGLAFWLFQTTCSEQVAWGLVAALATLAVVSIIPFLPSRTSGAAVFALERLPEDEGYETRVAMRRDALAGKYGLTEREVEVLDRLLQGKTRQQIADELILSPWTIKDRTAKIYEKTGVHSFKELLQLVEGDQG